MAQYIQKDILVAEIKERIETYNKGYANGDDRRADALEVLLHDIDTLEVKEVDSGITLEDISALRQIMFDYNRQVRNEMSIPNDEEYCKEVLSRFKAQKGEKVRIIIMQEEPVSEELEEAAKRYVTEGDEISGLYIIDVEADAFKAGAKWKEEQFEKNRLKHCNSITNEQAELEQDFIDQHIDKNKRMPTFLDAIEYGMQLQKTKDQKTIETAIHHAYHKGRLEMKEQMMAKAIDVEVKIDAGGYPYIPQMELYDYDKDVPLAKEGKKVKVIVIKEK